MQEVADRMELEVLKVGVATRRRRDLRDIELVSDVAVHPEPLIRYGADRLAGELERDGLVAEPASADRFRDDRTLIADHRVLDSRLQRVRPDRPEHPPGHENDVDPCRARGRDRGLRPRAEDAVLADQRAIEVAGDCLELAWEVLGEVQPCGFVRKSTSALRSLAGIEAYDFGMTPLGKPAWMYLSGSTIDSRVKTSSG